jgi:hypothetical protein
MTSSPRKPYSSVTSNETGRISISLARACHGCIFHPASLSHLQTSYLFKEKNTTNSPTMDYLLAAACRILLQLTVHVQLLRTT